MNSEELIETINNAIFNETERLSFVAEDLSALPPEVGQLKHLKELTIIGNPMKTLPKEIGLMTNLQKLIVLGNEIFDIPHEIGQLRNLRELVLSENRLSNLPDTIGDLQDLLTLGLSGNSLTKLPSTIGNLSRLVVLDVSDNHLTDIPVEITKLGNLRKLDLRDNPLNIPPEILDKINNPETILAYLSSGSSLINEIITRMVDIDNIPTGKFLEAFASFVTRPIREAKVILVGQGSVGKTSLVDQIIYSRYFPNQSKTEGISIRHWDIRDHLSKKEEGGNTLFSSNKSSVKYEIEHIQLNLWDFGGQEIMHATHQFFLTKRSLYLLVLDSRVTQEENRVEYWLKIIQSFGGESPVLIVGNKIDQHPLDIDRTGLQKKYTNIVGILETSAATGAGIEELKAAITEQVNNLPHVRDLLPETWFTVKTKLEELGHESNFITHDKYLELCAENEVRDETSQRTLIGFLHDLGVVLHFQDDPRLEALGILNPQWVTNGVYKILNSHELFQNKGVLALTMLNSILNINGYPRDKRLFIVDMMKKFELCYDIEADKTFLVPDLLPKDEPAELKFNGVPAFEYAYPVLPSSVITRFIVRMNQKIDDGFVWRTGVVLKIGENKALVKADIEDRKITIAIDGLEHTRRDALSAIRYQLDEIHGSIKGLDAQKRVPIPGAPNAEPLEYDYLLMLEREGQESHLVKDGTRLVKVNVRQVLSAIESESQRKERGGNVTNIYISGDVKGGTIIAGDENEVKR